MATGWPPALLVAIVLTGCGSATTASGTPQSDSPQLTSPSRLDPSSSAPASPSETFGKRVTQALAQVTDEWAYFCVVRGSITSAIPERDALLALDADPRLAAGAEALLNLGTPPKGWLEIANTAHGIGAAITDASLATILITARVRDGASTADVSEAWDAQVLAPCRTVRAEIDHLKELLDKMP